VDRGEGPDGVVSVFVGPDRNAPVERGKIGEEVVVDELVERQPAGLRDEQRGETEAPDLIVEQFGGHFLNVSQIR
jgi:hypothetical protein